jgi:hypothetical protein
MVPQFQKTTSLSSSVIIINVLKLTAIYPVSSIETEVGMLADYAHEGFHTWSADLSCMLGPQIYEYVINVLLLLTYFINFTSIAKLALTEERN